MYYVALEIDRERFNDYFRTFVSFDVHIYIYIFCVRDSTGQNRFRVVPIRSSSLFTKLLIIARVHLALATMRSACMVHPPLGIDRPVQSSPTPLSLSLFPLRDAIQYLYTVLITTLIHLLSSPFVRHSGSATGSSNFNEFVSRISIETRKIDSIHADRPVWKESFILYNRFINRYCEITS